MLGTYATMELVPPSQLCELALSRLCEIAEAAAGPQQIPSINAL